MATFKVGDRVRIIRTGPPVVRGYSCLGREATILSPLFQTPLLGMPGMYGAHRLAIDGYGNAGPNGTEWAAPAEWLAPLTDPKADAFLANVKSWGPLKEKMTLGKLTDEILGAIRGGSL